MATKNIATIVPPHRPWEQQSGSNGFPFHAAKQQYLVDQQATQQKY